MSGNIQPRKKWVKKSSTKVVKEQLSVNISNNNSSTKRWVKKKKAIVTRSNTPKLIFLYKLPFELMVHIIGYVENLKSIVLISLSCRYLNKYISDNKNDIFLARIPWIDDIKYYNFLKFEDLNYLVYNTKVQNIFDLLSTNYDRFKHPEKIISKGRRVNKRGNKHGNRRGNRRNQ